MSIEPREPHEHEPADFGLGRFHLDPMLDSTMDGLELAEVNMPPITEKERIHRELSRLNDELETTGWIGTTVRYTGKLRLAPELPEEGTEDTHNFMAKNRHFDERGELMEHVNVVDQPLIMGLIDLNLDLEHPPVDAVPRYVFTFIVPEALSDLEQGLYQDVVHSAGQLMAYPEDITMVDFDRPSPQQLERDLELNHPRIYNDIMEPGGVHADSPDGRQIWRSLKRFEIPVDSRYDAKFLSGVGDVLYARMDPDANSQYEFFLDGEIYTLAAPESDKSKPVPIKKKESPRKRLRGYFCKVDFMEVEGVNRPAIIVAERAAQYDDSVERDWELRLLPIDSVIDIRWGRERDKRFGERAVMKFESPEAVANYWRTLTEQAAEEPEEEQLVHDEKSLFAALEDDFHSNGAYNEEQGFYEYDISEDLVTILDALRHSMVTSAIPEDDLFLSEKSLAILNQAFETALQKCLRFKPGSMLATKGSCTVGITSEKRTHFEVIGESKRIRGNIVGITIDTVPSTASLIGNKAHETHTKQFCLVLDDPLLFSDLPGSVEDDRPLGSVQVVLPIVPANIVQAVYGPHIQDQ